MPKLLVPLALCTAAAAQIPFGHLVYVNRVTSATVAAIGIVDPATGVVTPLVPETGALNQHGCRSVAIDPAVPDVAYSITQLAMSVSATVPVLHLTGNRFTRTSLQVNLGVPGLPFHVRWASGHGLLLLGRGGQVNRMFLRTLTSTGAIPQPTATLLPSFATDMTCIGSKAYAVSEGDGTAAAVGTIVEWDLAANTDRVVGTGYPPFFAMAPFGGSLLLCGDAAGSLHLVDPATGAASLFVATGLGRITSIATDAAQRVFVVVENGTTWAIHDALSPGAALYTSTVAVDDLVFGPSPVATMLAFGDGCTGSTLLQPNLWFTAPPALGATFSVTLDSALPSTLTLLAFGTSRVADGFGPLPRDLGPAGMPSCMQLTDLAGSYAALTNPLGTASLPFTLPANPIFAGAQVPLQWLCLDTAANPFGATTSNGGELHVR